MFNYIFYLPAFIPTDTPGGPHTKPTDFPEPQIIHVLLSKTAFGSLNHLTSSPLSSHIISPRLFYSLYPPTLRSI